MKPRSEPIAWSVVVAAVLAAAASYGLDLTPELRELLVLVGPFLFAALWARFHVYAPDTVDEIIDTLSPPPESTP